MEMYNNKSNNENEVFFIFQQLVHTFEKYETIIFEDANSFDSVYDQQIDCLNLLEAMIKSEENHIYFTALINIRNDLINQMQLIESRKNEICINDLTIIRINKSNELLNRFEPAEPLRKRFKSKEEENIIRIIESTLVVPVNTGLNDLNGLEKEKSLLKEAIVYPMLYPHLFTGSRKKWNKALLYGPPGTGKTQFAHCLAAEIKANFYNVSSADLLSRYVGESEKIIKNLFQYCQTIPQQQCLIFIDEIDGICRTRNDKESEFERRMKNELLAQLSEIDRNPNNKIFFLASTNCPWDLDPAFLRRFQRRIYVSLPNRKTRLELLKYQIESINNLIKNNEWKQIIDATEGWTGSDLMNLINFAMYQPLKDLHSAKYWILVGNKYMPIKEKTRMAIEKNIKDFHPNQITVRPVEITDFIIALNNITKTVAEEDVSKFETFNQKYGSVNNNYLEN